MKSKLDEIKALVDSVYPDISVSELESVNYQNVPKLSGLGVFIPSSHSAVLYNGLISAYKELQTKLSALNTSTSSNYDANYQEYTAQFEVLKTAFDSYNQIQEADLKLNKRDVSVDKFTSTLDQAQQIFRSIEENHTTRCAVSKEITLDLSKRKGCLRDKVTILSPQSIDLRHELSISASALLGNSIVSRQPMMSCVEDLVSNGIRTTKDEVLARCIACSTDPLPEGFPSYLAGLRKNYDLTFPNKTEYAKNRSDLLVKMIETPLFNGEKPAEMNKINIILCEENSKGDVITATEQYVLKLKSSAERKRSNFFIKVVGNQTQLKENLDFCNSNNLEVHFTNISHGSSESLGYLDLDEDVKKLLIKFLRSQDAQSSGNKLTSADVSKLVSTFGDYSGSEEGLKGALDQLKALQTQGDHSGPGLDSMFLDAHRGYLSKLGKEQDSLVELINGNSSITRVRLLACTSGGASEIEGQREALFDLGNSTANFDDRTVNKLLTISTDAGSLRKIEAIAAQVTRPGVIIKGELGVLNPGLGGKISYGSAAGGNGTLYERSSSAGKEQGSLRFVSTNPVSNSSETYIEYKARMSELTKPKADKEEDSKPKPGGGV